MTSVPYFSQYGEDRLLEELFEHKTTGCCIEVGGNDGILNSNSYHFELLSWKTILVEPIPRLCTYIKQQRPLARVIECAASDHAGTCQFNIAQGVDGMSSMLADASYLSSVANQGGRIETITVTMRTLDAILEEEGVVGIDFITVDVEGAEMQVLRGFSLERWRPRLVIIEDNSHGADTTIIAYLQARGYVNIHRTGVNDWFAHASDAQMLAKFDLPSFRRKRAWLPWRHRGAKLARRILPGRLRALAKRLSGQLPFAVAAADALSRPPLQAEGVLWLSICIPTYNFGRFIGATLESIATQALTGVEVIVLDGGSTDDTATVVESFHARIPNLHYVKRAEKGGIDRDIEYAIEAASGEYVWTFSADDTMVEHAIEKLAGRIVHGDDVVLCETILCDVNLVPKQHYLNADERHERSYDLNDDQERRIYFQQARNTQALFSFCGALIFKRRTWVDSPYRGEFIGSCWSHVARLLAQRPQGLRVRLVPEAWSKKRGDNDSFARNGIVNRVAIGIEGYLGIAQRYFPADGFEQLEIERLLRNEYHLRCMLAQKALLHESGRDQDIPRLLALHARIRSAPTLGNLWAKAMLRLMSAAGLSTLRRLLRKLLGRTA